MSVENWENFDSVSILGVRAMGKHGVFPHEKQEEKPFIADIQAWIHSTVAAESDDLSCTISYADMAADACEVIEGESVDLIETLAEKIAAKVLRRGALAVEVTLHKPQAPLDIPFADACVKVRRKGDLLADGKIRRVVLALGSNMGDSKAIVDQAVERISDLPVHIVKVSSYITSKAQLAPGQEAQPDYTNAVLSLTTALSPLALLEALQEIEVRGGRVRHERWGARTLDIDIIDVEGITSEDPLLTLPHPRAGERAFVMGPWVEIEPEAVLSGCRVADRLKCLVTYSRADEN